MNVTPSMSSLPMYETHLLQSEYSQATVNKYLRDVTAFLNFISNHLFSGKEQLIQYKEEIAKKYAVSSVNSMLAAVNHFMDFLGLAECKVKLLRNQKRIFCPKERELSHEEYTRLVKTANGQGREQLSLVLQTICSTGIRVGELRFITVKAVQDGQTDVHLKGKVRTIILPQMLCKKLLHYLAAEHIDQGPVFVTRGGNPLDRSNIWSSMKRLCKDAGVSEYKVFPHNLRHLFARMFYRIEKDIVCLADILGHSNVETTRNYIISSGEEHEHKLSAMCLVYQ